MGYGEPSEGVERVKTVTQSVQSTKKKNFRRSVLIQVSDFSLGRGLFLKEALARAGLDVSVITNQPIYQKTIEEKCRKENHFALNIPFAKALYCSILGRLIFYTLFSALAFFTMIRLRAQILYSRGPQPFTEISCIIYKMFYPDATIISDTTDLWPDSLEFVKINPTLKSLFIRMGLGLNKRVYKHVDAIVTHNDELGKILQERFAKPIHIIYGVVDLSKFRAMGKEQAAIGLHTSETRRLLDKFVILYAGLLGPFQDPLKIIDLAKESGQDTTFLIAGTGPMKKEFQERASSLHLENITFLDTQPFESMPYLYNIADLHLLTYAKIPFLKIGLPKKFIEYAACGKPILCLTPPCVASELATTWNAGCCADPDDTEELANMIKQLKEHPERRDVMGKNARLLAENLFSINSATEVLKTVIQS